MHRRGLIQLRFGFLLLGGVLLLPLFLLLRAAEARFEQQRELRHRIVAERIFDEMERELTTLLEAEQGRPSRAYDAQRTRASSWSPVVLGYFTQGPNGTRLLARDQLGTSRIARVEGAARALWRAHGQALVPRPRTPDPPRTGHSTEVAEKETRVDGTGEDAETDLKVRPRALPKQDSVLRKLNRGVGKRRGASNAKPKQKPPRRRRSSDDDDPLAGLDGL
ncbi:MAG: hypothetical protein OXU20_01135 [Myxococcales bacterium]|nr:hypothetical protein [Myxococcales bacterium]